MRPRPAVARITVHTYRLVRFAHRSVEIEDGGEDDQPAHGGRPRLRPVPGRRILADRLAAVLHLAEALYQPGAQHEGDHDRRHRRHRRPERDVAEDVEGDVLLGERHEEEVEHQPSSPPRRARSASTHALHPHAPRSLDEKGVARHEPLEEERHRVLERGGVMGLGQPASRARLPPPPGVAAHAHELGHARAPPPRRPGDGRRGRDRPAPACRPAPPGGVASSRAPRRVSSAAMTEAGLAL